MLSVTLQRNGKDEQHVLLEEDPAVYVARKLQVKEGERFLLCKNIEDMGQWYVVRNGILRKEKNQ